MKLVSNYYNLKIGQPEAVTIFTIDPQTGNRTDAQTKYVRRVVLTKNGYPFFEMDLPNELIPLTRFYSVPQMMGTPGYFIIEVHGHIFKRLPIIIA